MIQNWTLYNFKLFNGYEVSEDTVSRSCVRAYTISIKNNRVRYITVY